MISNIDSTTSIVEQSQVVKYGDTLYLQHMTDRYMNTINRSRYSFVRLEDTEAVGLKIVGEGEGELTDGAIIQLQSTESSLGERNTLGAFADRHDCYYWKEGYNKKKQGWRINKRNSDGDSKIRYDDQVYLTNLYYKNQQLARCTRFPGYITTFTKANEWWTIKAEVTPSDGDTTSETQFLQRSFEPDNRELSKANMAYLGYCAEAVYASPEESKVKLEKLGFKINDLEHFIDFPETNTQCIIVGDEEKVIIAFRGTENLDDWKTNVNLAKAAWKVGMVHSGFWRSIDSVWPTVTARLNSLRTNNQPIWITGHSLGGALATLACGILDDELPEESIAGVYTFGQPRVGDLLFAQTVDKRVKKRFFRVVNNNDIVTRIPSIKYQHVGNQLYFDARGNLHENVIISFLNPKAIWYRLQGYYQNISQLNLSADSIGDHRMGDYRLLIMRQLREKQ